MKLNIVSCPPVTTVLIKRPDLKYQLGFSVQNGIVSLLGPRQPPLCPWMAVAGGGGSCLCALRPPAPEQLLSDGASSGQQPGQAGWVGRRTGGLGPSSPPGHPIPVVVFSADPCFGVEESPPTSAFGTQPVTASESDVRKTPAHSCVYSFTP